MARRGWSTANYLKATSAVVTAYPFTMSAWCKTSILATQQTIMGLFDSGSSASAGGQCRLAVSSGNKVRAIVANTLAADTSTSISASTWFHALGVWTSNTLRAAFLNGAGKGTQTTSQVVASFDTTVIGCAVGSSTNEEFAPSGTGDLAEAVVYNVALSDVEALAISRGIHPFLIRGASIVAYWPIYGLTSPEPNRKSNASAAKMAITGALSASPHPNINTARAGLRYYFRGTTALTNTAQFFAVF